jgi:hypothetical protein
LPQVPELEQAPHPDKTNPGKNAAGQEPRLNKNPSQEINKEQSNA